MGHDGNDVGNGGAAFNGNRVDLSDRPSEESRDRTTKREGPAGQEKERTPEQEKGQEMKTKIEWATHTWNPVTGCTPISEGCEHCYAARMAKRLAGRCGYPKDDPFRPGTFHADKLNDPLKIKKPSLFFVCSMGDLFHEAVKDELIDMAFAVMATAKHHTFILLTKRPQRMLNYCTGGWQPRLIPHLRMLEKTPEDKGVSLHTRNMALPNVWLGVTAENQARADERIPILLSIPAAVRFVSVEPMLGPVDLTTVIDRHTDHFTFGVSRESYLYTNVLIGHQCFKGGYLPHQKLDWVICGGETGPSARPMHPDWARSLRDQCKADSVPFFFKSWGARGGKVGKQRTGDLIDGTQYHEYPEGR